ncbi:MAG: CPBP family intramembrane metalloprotease [Acidobacteria bacterium]|nr:CPBP family intramembrane metalloprotease [Acidobacteriota bacterium]
MWSREAGPGPEPGGAIKIDPRAIVHQEGILGLIAIVGLGLRDRSPVAGLLPRGGLVPALGVGVAAGLGTFLLVWAFSRIPAIHRLEGWQRDMVGGWGMGDVISVALISGLMEEALIRALFQPIVGLVPAAVIFGLLHFVPDRKAWIWPLLATVLGAGLGVLFEVWGYPAAAAAHATINLGGFWRLRRQHFDDHGGPRGQSGVE